MTALGKPALRAVDWAAIRRDYEEGDDLIRDIAAGPQAGLAGDARRI